MRFLALQTDPGQLKKQFIVEGEEEILSTASHPFIFIFPAVGMTLLLIAFAGLIVGVSEVVDGVITAGVVFGMGFVVYLYLLLSAYIRWRFNFLIVTTEKVVIVKHRSFIYQNVNPIHLEDIERTRFESQFFGIWRCGIVHICLKEREGGTTREIVLPYIPQPDVVSSAVENAKVLAKQRTQGETQEEQLPKVQDVQQKVQESVGKEPAGTPTVEPPTKPVSQKM